MKGCVQAMMDYMERFNKMVEDSKNKENNDLYLVALYWVASCKQVNIGDCPHDTFVSITHDARLLTTIVTRNYVIVETSDEIFIDDYARYGAGLTQLNALRLSDELSTSIGSAKTLAEVFRDALKKVPHDPR